MSFIKTIGQILQIAQPNDVAIRSPGRPPLTYADLSKFVSNLGGCIRAQPINRSDRVAIVLPNGPNMATAFLGAAHAAIAAPLNPAYTKDEFAFYMGDISAKLLITDDADGLAAQAANGLGIPVALISTNEQAQSGVFETTLPQAENLSLSDANENDEALVLHTSGTTSRPKIVPLSQANICSSAANVAAALELSKPDVCMNIMPLFHIHGLIAAVLSTLQSGGSIYCTPGFNALKVFSWLEDASPSWYTAVPTMHQAILGRAKRNEAVLEKINLRFVRSSSSSLPPQVMSELEQAFQCPVVEAYGMTEAAHQMTSNPITPNMQKPGSVGKAAGPDVMLFADGVLFRDPEKLGEIVISGDNITSGYEANEKANAKSFVPDPKGGQRWFRTGDQGQFDRDGYLSITGRLKEIINRGGEKISPREVDEILMDHPAISQAVTFALPHKLLGEDVAVAIILRDGAEATPAEIREFASKRLAAFKVPQKVLIVDDIPKGATGKLQRIGLHKKLGLGST